MIQAEMSEQIGYGLFISYEAQADIEAEIRQKYAGTIEGIENKYLARS